MSEQRLIDANDIWLNDANVLYGFLSEQLVQVTGAFSRGVNKGLNIARSALKNPQINPPIDPETLPIVKELREKLAQYEKMMEKMEPVVHAHWEDMEPELVDENHDYRCSRCLSYDTIHPELIHNAMRCHHCGAHMDEEV